MFSLGLTQNVFIESFNGKSRDNLLNEVRYDTLNAIHRDVALRRFNELRGAAPHARVQIHTNDYHPAGSRNEKGRTGMARRHRMGMR